MIFFFLSGGWMTSFLPQVETTTSSVSAGCVSGSETLFAVQSQIQKLNMLRGPLSWPSGVTSALRQCYFFFKRTSAREREGGSVCKSSSRRLQRFARAQNVYFFFFFFFVEGEMESSSLTAHSDHLSRFVKKTKKNNTPVFLNGAFERDTREEGSRFAAESDTKNLASFQKWSSSGRFWACFLHQRKTKKKTKESTRLKWVKKGGWQGGTVMWDDKEVVCQRGSLRRETEISINNV